MSVALDPCSNIESSISRNSSLDGMLRKSAGIPVIRYSLSPKGSMGKDEFKKGSTASATEYAIKHTDEVKDPGDQQGHSRL